MGNKNRHGGDGRGRTGKDPPSHPTLVPDWERGEVTLRDRSGPGGRGVYLRLPGHLQAVHVTDYPFDAKATAVDHRSVVLVTREDSFHLDRVPKVSPRHRARRPAVDGQGRRAGHSGPCPKTDLHPEGRDRMGFGLGHQGPPGTSPVPTRPSGHPTRYHPSLPTVSRVS